MLGTNNDFFLTCCPNCQEFETKNLDLIIYLTIRWMTLLHFSWVTTDIITIFLPAFHSMTMVIVRRETHLHVVVRNINFNLMEN